MHINIQKLKGKMAEENISANELSSAIGVDKTTFYRKLREGGGKFTVCLLYTSPSPRDA